MTFVGTATDLVDGSRPVSCSPASGSTFPLGTTTVNCSATDTRGNAGTGSFTVTVRDSTAPAVVSSPASGSTTNDSTLTFSGTAEALSTVSLYNGTNTTIATTTATSTGTWSATSGTATSNGVHSIAGKATDKAGNVSPASSAVSVTIYTVRPTVSITSPSDGLTRACQRGWRMLYM